MIEQIGDEYGVTVRYEVESSCVTFFAAEVTGVGVEPDRGVKHYWRKGAESSTDDTTDFSDAERYIEGAVKWDGCSHFNFGDENGYLHLCGADDIGKLANACKVVYERCGELMKANGGNLLEGEFKCDAERNEDVW